MCDFWIVYENKFEILTEIILYNLEKGKVTELSKLVSASVVTGPVIQESWRGRFHGWPGYLYTHILRNSATPHAPHGMRHLSSWPRSLQLSLLEFTLPKIKNKKNMVKCWGRANQSQGRYSFTPHIGCPNWLFGHVTLKLK